MILIKSAADLDFTLAQHRQKGKEIGFVATMGALHQGHISLIERSKKENDTTVCSIFVNPRQFNDPGDLEKYPRTIEKDIVLLTNTETDILFLPGLEDIYPPDYHEPTIHLNGIGTVLEGALRPGHFNGVAIVVKRLFDCVKPDKAYFGQKDFQQTLVIKELVKQFKLPVEIVISDIFREDNGLAMSSRNIRLGKSSLQKAGFIYQALTDLKVNASKMSLKQAIGITSSEILKNEGTKIEYLEIVDPDTLVPLNSIASNQKAIALIVVNYNGVRLLDNIYL